MGILGKNYINRELEKLTLGKNKICANYNNLFLNGENFKISKGELLSLFTNQEDKDIAEKYFNYFNSGNSIFSKNISQSMTPDEPDNYLDSKEISSMFNSLAKAATTDQNNLNLSEEELENSTGIKGADVFFKMVKKITETTDYTLNINSGSFVFNGEDQDFEVTPIDGDPRSYNLKNSNGNYTATFGGPDAILQVMTCSFYSMLFADPDLNVEQIISPSGENGTTWAKSDISKHDSIKKLGMDAFLGNTECLPNFAGAFDIDSHNQKKSFTFIPEEFETLLHKDNYSAQDVIKAIKTICKLKDGDDIRQTLYTFGYHEQYGDLLVKRKEFFKTMYSIARKNPPAKGISGAEYFTKLKLAAIEKTTKATTDIRDFASIQKSIDKISDVNTKIKLQKLLNEKKDTLNPHEQVVPLPEVTEEELLAILKQYDYYAKENTDSYNDLYRNLTDEEIQSIKEKYKYNSDAIIKIAQQPLYICDLLTYVNSRRKLGIDILNNKDEFNKCLIIADLMGDLGFLERVYDKNIQTVINWAFDNPPVEKEISAIKMYKSEDFWQINNALSTQKNNGTEPLPKASEHIDNLTKYLNKITTPKDITTYRGEGYFIFNSIKLSDTETLAEAMERISIQIKENNNNVDETIKKEIDKIISIVQESNYIATQERFLSTSADQDVANKFGEVMLILNIPAGSKAACVDATFITDEFSEEAEILCQRGSQLQITDICYNEEDKKWQINANVITN